LGHIDYLIFMNGAIKKYLIEDHLHRTHLLIIKQHGVTPLFATKLGRKTMINKVKLTLIAAIAASSIALPAAALAQSAYTTGTAASRSAAGYPSPYGYGSGLYDYAPGHFTATPFQDRHPRHAARFSGFTQVQLAYGGHNFDRTLDPFTDDTPLACGRGRVRDPQSNLCRGPADISTAASFARYAPMSGSLPSELA
jgi:hypothetical protein